MNEFDIMIPKEFHYPGMEQDIEGVQLLVSTIEGTIPGNRDFGMDADLISSSIDEGENLFLVSLIEKMEYYFPKLDVESVDFKPSITGNGLHGTIHLTVASDEEETEEESEEEGKEETEDE